MRSGGAGKRGERSPRTRAGAPLAPAFKPFANFCKFSAMLNFSIKTALGRYR